LIRDGEVDLVVNTPFGRGPRTDKIYYRAIRQHARGPLPGLLGYLQSTFSLDEIIWLHCHLVQMSADDRILARPSARHALGNPD